MMNSPLRVLHLEDSPDDAILIRRKLRAEFPRCEVIRVDDESGFRAGLKAGPLDLILSDYRVPAFHGMNALMLARELCPEVPFLFLSGLLGDELAVDCLKAGATDYLLKDRPARFAPAVRRALTEADLRAKRKHFQAELEQRNRDLLKRNQEIENFYHTLSHELKTPLTSALEFIAIVVDGLGGPINDAQKEYLGIAKDSCHQMRNCINDLLDATRLETGKFALHTKPAALDALAHRVLTALRPAAQEKKVTLTEEIQPGLPLLPLDEQRMVQVISNLLGNALKYTPPGGSVFVKVSEVADALEFSVRDTGCGIPRAEQEHIFDRLYQVKTGDAATGGIGLGLYLCRELVQLHGGRIWVESQPGKGSTFRFVIPKSTGTK